jgi:hypothetical protein
MAAMRTFEQAWARMVIINGQHPKFRAVENRHITTA